MTIARESQAVEMLRDFISELKLASLPKATIFRGLNVLEVTLGQVSRQEDLLRIEDELAEWVSSVPQDFDRPTFEQLMAHVVTIMFSFHRDFLFTRRARDISRDRRPGILKDEKEFLSNYLLRKVLDRKGVPDAALQRGCVQMVADFFVRLKVPIVEDETPVEEFGQRPMHEIVLALYMRARKLGTRYKEGEGSLEFQLLNSGVLEQLCARHAGLIDFVGPAGLGIMVPTNWWTRLQRQVRRWFIGEGFQSHKSALATEYWFLLFLLLANFVLITRLWIPMREESARMVEELNVDAAGRDADRIIERLGGSN
ncbi:MAG: hypothetical protein KBD56_01520 [Candidatus Eisenbacteria bacterium]|nr:hypothetical protein [Candidatus Eisenbacteria bacterium]